MGLFDSYFDPQQFQDSGGLVGRMLSLQQQQGQYQPSGGFDQAPTAPSPGSPIGAPSNPQTPDYGQTQNIPIGRYQMPQFGRADVPQPAPQTPDFGGRLSAGFQSWAHTPVGNPFAALANGTAAFGAGQPTDVSGVVPPQATSQTSAPSPGFGDRLSAGLQSWAHTPVGNPMAAVANGFTGFGTGQRTDPPGMVQQILQPRIDASGNPQQDLSSQYQALRPLLGDQNAMLAIVHPELGQTLIAQLLKNPPKEATASGQPPGFANAPPVGGPPGYVGGTGRTGRGNKAGGSLRDPANNPLWSTKHGQ
jgi:hypothetical protein